MIQCIIKMRFSTKEKIMNRWICVIVQEKSSLSTFRLQLCPRGLLVRGRRSDLSKQWYQWSLFLGQFASVMVSAKLCRPSDFGEKCGTIGPVRENLTSLTSGDFVVISGLSENIFFGQSPILRTSPTIKHEAFTFSYLRFEYFNDPKGMSMETWKRTSKNDIVRSELCRGLETARMSRKNRIHSL